MFSNLQLIALLASTAAALPQASSSPAPSPPFTLLSVHSGNMNVHQRPIEAFNGSFWLGKSPSTAEHCQGKPEEECPIRTTVLYTDAGHLNLHDAQRPGQSVYVDEKGYLSFTPEGHNVFPPGSVSVPFSWVVPPKGQGAELKTPFPLYACPEGATGTTVYKIISTSNTPDQQCVDIAAQGFEYTGGEEADYYL